MGMRPIVIDTGDAKKKLALDMGAEEFVDFKQVENVAEEVKKIAGGVGAHGVIVTAPQAYKDAISYIGDRVSGKVMCVGLRKCSLVCIEILPWSWLTRGSTAPAGTTTIGADPSQFAFKNLHVIGTLVGTMKDTAMALEYAQRGLLKQIAEVRGMSQMPESVQQLRRGEVPGRIVIDFNKD